MHGRAAACVSTQILLDIRGRAQYRRKLAAAGKTRAEAMNWLPAGRARGTGLPSLGSSPFWAMGGTRAGGELAQANPWSAASQGRRWHASEVPSRTLSRLGGVAWSL